MSTDTASTFLKVVSWLIRFLANLIYAWLQAQVQVQAQVHAQARMRQMIQREHDEELYQHWRQSCDDAFKDPTLSLPKPPFWPDVFRLLNSGDDPVQRQKDEKKRWHPDRLHFTQRRNGAPAWASKLFIAIQNAEV